MILTVNKMSEASAKQAEALTSYFSLFTTTSSPTARTMRDEDEARLELSRRGYPVDGTPDEQAKWVLEQTRY